MTAASFLKGALFALLLLGPAHAQDEFGAARDNGKSFAAGMAERVQNQTAITPSGETVPHYAGDELPQGAYFSEPDRIETDAADAKSANSGYRAMDASMRSRATFDPATIDETIARANLLNADPALYTGGMSVTGTEGSCTKLPATEISPGSYIATCNRGLKLERSAPTCAVTRNVTVKPVSSYRYECSAFNADVNGTDRCDLFASASCTITGTRDGACLQWSGPVGQPGRWCTEPGEPVRQLTCDAEIPGAALLGTNSETVVSDVIGDTLCAGPTADSSCSLASEVCTDGAPTTRTVSGVSVTRDCWAWERSYFCEGTAEAEDCGALDSDPGCAFKREACLTEDTPCLTYERIYQCAMPPQPSDDHYVCDGDVYCIGEVCETIERVPNDEFRDAAVALNAVAQASGEFDPENLTLFTGERNTCSKPVFGLIDCCRGKSFPLLPGASLLVSLGCDRAEVELHQKDSQGLCAYIGSYCSAKTLGVCTKKRKAYCCFESRTLPHPAGTGPPADRQALGQGEGGGLRRVYGGRIRAARSQPHGFLRNLCRVHRRRAPARRTRNRPGHARQNRPLLRHERRLSMTIPAAAAVPSILLLLASCLGSAEPARAFGGLVDTPDGEDRFYCQERELGDWFYCAEPNRAQKPAPEPILETPAPSAATRLERVTGQLRELKALAILEPTTENVAAYIRFQREQLDRASLFSDVWQRAVWQTPDLDYTLQRPIGTVAKRDWLDRRKADRHAALDALGDRYGLFYFFAQSCGACTVMSPIVKSVADRHGITVRAISTDGGPSPIFPNYRVETSERTRLGLADDRTAPAVVLFDSQTRTPIPIGYGIIAADELTARIYTLTKLEPGHDF